MLNFERSGAETPEGTTTVAVRSALGEKRIETSTLVEEITSGTCAQRFPSVEVEIAREYEPGAKSRIRNRLRQGSDVLRKLSDLAEGSLTTAALQTSPAAQSPSRRTRAR